MRSVHNGDPFGPHFAPMPGPMLGPMLDLYKGFMLMSGVSISKWLDFEALYDKTEPCLKKLQQIINRVMARRTSMISRLPKMVGGFMKAARLSGLGS